MCPACSNKRVHAREDWKYHPYATHGFNGSFWTHPDLVPPAKEKENDVERHDG